MLRTIVLALTICAISLPAHAQMHTPTFDVIDWPAVFAALGLGGVSVWLRG